MKEIAEEVAALDHSGVTSSSSATSSENEQWKRCQRIDRGSKF